MEDIPISTEFEEKYFYKSYGTRGPYKALARHDWAGHWICEFCPTKIRLRQNYVLEIDDPAFEESVICLCHECYKRTKTNK